MTGGPRINENFGEVEIAPGEETTTRLFLAIVFALVVIPAVPVFSASPADDTLQRPGPIPDQFGPTLVVPSRSQPARSGSPTLIVVRTAAGASCSGRMTPFTPGASPTALSKSIADSKGEAVWKLNTWGARGDRELVVVCTLNGKTATLKVTFEVQ